MAMKKYGVECKGSHDPKNKDDLTKEAKTDSDEKVCRHCGKTIENHETKNSAD